MSKKGSSAIFTLTKKIATIPNLPVILFAFLVIFSLISCEGGVYSDKNAELLYTYDYDSIAYKQLGGGGHGKTASIDFTNSDNAIITFEYRSNVNFVYQFEIYSNQSLLSFINHSYQLSETDLYLKVIDTVKLSAKGKADMFQVSFYQIPWIDSNRFSVVRNIKIYSN